MGVVSVCLPHHRVSPGNRGGFVATGRELQRAPARTTQSVSQYTRQYTRRELYTSHAHELMVLPTGTDSSSRTTFVRPGLRPCARQSARQLEVRRGGWRDGFSQLPALSHNSLSHARICLCILCCALARLRRQHGSKAGLMVGRRARRPAPWRARTLCLAPAASPFCTRHHTFGSSPESFDASRVPRGARAAADGCASVVRITWRRSRYSQPERGHAPRVGAFIDGHRGWASNHRTRSGRRWRLGLHPRGSGPRGAAHLQLLGELSVHRGLVIDVL